MRMRPGWKVSLAVISLLLGSLAVVLASFLWAGFPLSSQPPTHLIWAEVGLVVLLLLLPLFR